MHLEGMFEESAKPEQSQQSEIAFGGAFSNPFHGIFHEHDGLEVNETGAPARQPSEGVKTGFGAQRPRGARPEEIGLAAPQPRPDPGEEARVDLLTRADRGEIDAIYALAQCYRFAGCTKADQAEAVDYYRYAADEGLPEALHELGDCYFVGFHVKTDENKAFELYSKAAAKGYAPAVKALAHCYDRGTGVKTDKNEAFRLCEDLAQRGDLESEICLAKLYRADDVPGQSQVEAFYWFTQAAENGGQEAYQSIGECYERGLGVHKSLRSACDAYSRASRSEITYNSLIRVAEALQQEGGESDLLKAFFAYKLLAEQYETEQAMFALAKCYETGLGIGNNPIAATNAYIVAANRFPTHANLCMVAKLLLSGPGVKENVETAVAFYKRVFAFDKLGDIFYEGLYSGKSMFSAGTYYLQAKQLNLQQLLRLLRIFQISPELRKKELERFQVIKMAASALRADILSRGASVFE